MRYVQMKYVEPGMQLARNLKDSNGVTLLRASGELDARTIDKLEQYGYAGLYISDRVSEGIEIDDVISEKIREQAIEQIKNKNIEGCIRVANQIVDELTSRGNIRLDITYVRAFDDAIYAHSVNVAIYACIIGIGMGYSRFVLNKLVVASLLHDLGKLAIPDEVTKKHSRLTPDEYMLIKTHAKLSYEYIKNSKALEECIKDAVLHHHENEDGSGYPDRIAGKALSIYSKILHVADVYDALVSKRPYKEPYSPNEVVEYLMGGCNIMFDSKVVDALIKYVPLFPLGTEVVLSDGRRAIVRANRGAHNLRPIIRFFNGTEMDLAKPENNSVIINTLGCADKKEIADSERKRPRMIGKERRPRILAVDDMITNLQMLRDILDDYYDMVYLKSGEQTLHYLEKNGVPDLILMDIEMPGLDGMDTVRAIRLQYGEVPVMFVTSRRDRNTILECKDIHMSGYIIKPYQATFIRSEIERILEGRPIGQ